MSYTFKPDPITPEEDKKRFIAWWKSEARKRRDELLRETDWIHFPDVTISDTYKTAMLEYRQQLRDIPTKFDALIDPDGTATALEISNWHYDALDWPTKPSP